MAPPGRWVPQDSERLGEFALLGKIAGGVIGYKSGGFPGLLLGVFIGHQIDRRLPYWMLKLLNKVMVKHHLEVQRAFFEATFSVMGHLAKADGRVSEQEIEVARQVMARMQLTAEAQREAIAFFGQGKEAGFDLDAMLQRLQRATQRRRDLLQIFLEIQLGAAYADGELHAAEREVLLKIFTTLGFGVAEFERLEAMIRAELHNRQGGGAGPASRTRGMSLEDAYAILNITESASDAEVKKAYRRLTSQHHPDKLAASGLPPEMMKMAEEKTHEIRTAYERIREVRGFK